MTDAAGAGWRRMVGPAGILGVYEVGPIQRAAPSGVLVVCHDVPSDFAAGTGSAPVAGQRRASSSSPGARASASPSGASAASAAATPTGPATGGGDVIGTSAAGLADVVSAFADRLSSGSPDWRVVGACLRGVAPSEGSCSLDGWADDLSAVVDAVATDAPGGGVWLCGLGAGGTIALSVATHDRRVRGVVVLGAPSSLAGAGGSDPGYGPAGQATVTPATVTPATVTPATATAATATAELGDFGDRPLLVLHGTDDHVVPTGDARSIVAADGPGAEIRFLHGAGHRLQADPRAVALLLGWLERQRP